MSTLGTKSVLFQLGTLTNPGLSLTDIRPAPAGTVNSSAYAGTALPAVPVSGEALPVVARPNPRSAIVPPMTEGEPALRNSSGVENGDRLVREVAQHLLSWDEARIGPLSERMAHELRSLPIPANIMDQNEFARTCVDFIETCLSHRGCHPDLSDRGRGIPFNCEGVLILENDHVKIQLDDPANALEGNENLKALLNIVTQEAKKFRTPSDAPFKAFVSIRDNSMSIWMVPGSHKESLNIMLSPDSGMPHILAYRHHPSQYERTSGHLTFRYDYISGVVNKGISGIKRHFPRTDQKTGEVQSLMLISEMDQVCEIFKRYFRLCQSVKDLDIMLKKEDVPFAVRMFEDGVTNMKFFLTFRHSTEGQRVFVLKRSLNPSEQTLLKEYVKHKKELEEFTRHINQRLDNLRRAKDLNYEILSDLSSLGEQALSILSISRSRPREADTFMKACDDVIGKFERMAHHVATYTIIKDYIYTYNFKDKLRAAALTLANIARFGQGSEDVLRFENGAVDISDHGKRYIPEVAWKAYEEFYNAFFRDKGTELMTWSEVESLEEAVRYLHATIVRTTRSTDFRAIKHPEYLQIGSGNTAISIVDLTGGERRGSTVARVVRDEINGLMPAIENIANCTSNKNVFTVILAEDFAEVMVRTGAHYIELNTQTHDRPVEHSISFRYIESGYFGSTRRQDFVDIVLQRAGFTVSRDRSPGRQLHAVIKTEDRKKWRPALGIAMRLITAMQNLDLGVARDVPELFERGVASEQGFDLFRSYLREAQGGQVTDHMKTWVQRIMERCTRSEKKYLVRLLIDNMKTFQEDLEPYLEGMTIGQLDDLVWQMYDLEDEAKVGGDKKSAARLRRIGKKIEEVIEAREK